MSPAAFSPALSARRVLRLAAAGALATLTGQGGPFASLVTVATTPAGEPILLLSTLAQHSRNLAADRRASLLLVAPGGEDGDPLAGARLTLTGTVGPRDTDQLLYRRFLARHAAAAGYADFADFGFHRFAVDGGHLVAGFGRIFSLSPADILVDVGAAGNLIAAEAGALAHMNGDHAEAVGLYATVLLGLPEGDWRLTGIDPHGIDLAAGVLRGRLDFAETVLDAGALRRVLADLAEVARVKQRSPGRSS
jgi:putative heme iron utilization protein